MYVRLMRNEGFNFEWYDKYCTNLFARHFERKAKWYEAVTAFEVMEHLDDPAVFLDEVFSVSDHLIFSTVLLPIERPRIGEWWYYAPETGQHITFYTEKGLRYLAEKRGKRYVHMENLHMFTNKSITDIEFENVVREHHRINVEKRRKSLLEAAYEMITHNRLK